MSAELDLNAVGLRVSRCRSCDARVVWAETLAGRRQILDAEPRTDGSVLVEDRGDGRLISHAYSGANLEAVRRRATRGEASLYLDHHCSDRERWRR